MLDSLAHFREGFYAVSLLKNLPSHVYGKLKKPREESPASDEIIGRWSLKRSNSPGWRALKDESDEGRQKFTSSTPAKKRGAQTSCCPLPRRIDAYLRGESIPQIFPHRVAYPRLSLVPRSALLALSLAAFWNQARYMPRRSCWLHSTSEWPALLHRRRRVIADGWRLRLRATCMWATRAPSGRPSSGHARPAAPW